jgi:transcriptional regulator of NAD metabolism
MAYRVYWIQKYGHIEKSVDVSSKEQAERLVRTLQQYGDTARCEGIGDDA